MKNPLFFNVLNTLIFFLFCSITFAQNAQIEIAEKARPFLRKFVDSNGLPSNSVMTLERDLNGFLWAGSQDGAGFFNGHRWTTINLPNRTISNYVYNIMATKDGAIWFGTDGGGIHKLQNGEWQTSTPAKVW